jgi:hypothetical protein
MRFWVVGALLLAWVGCSTTESREFEAAKPYRMGTLPEDVAHYIAEAMPDFRLLNETDYAIYHQGDTRYRQIIHGDFNGDGADDVALLLTNGTDRIEVLVVHRGEESWSHVVLTSFAPKSSTDSLFPTRYILTAHPPGVVETSRIEQDIVDRKNLTLPSVYCSEVSTTQGRLFYFEDGSYQDVETDLFR